MKALILIGGKGTRMHPASSFCPKEMFPMIRRPFLDLVIEQLESAGICGKDIIFIMSKEKKDILKYYKNKHSYMFDSGTGLGNAIVEAVKKFRISGQFVVLLGDMLYLSSKNLIKDMIYKGKIVGSGVIGGFKHTDDYHKYCSIVYDPNNMTVYGLYEKPSERVSDYSCSGQYLFNTKFVEYLKEYSDSGEAFGFTDAMNDYLIFNNIYLAPLNDGDVMLDVGTPDAYVNSLVATLRFKNDAL